MLRDHVWNKKGYLPQDSGLHNVGWEIDKAIGAAIFLFGALFALGLRPKKVTLGGTSIEI